MARTINKTLVNPSKTKNVDMWEGKFFKLFYWALPSKDFVHSFKDLNVQLNWAQFLSSNESNQMNKAQVWFIGLKKSRLVLIVQN